MTNEERFVIGLECPVCGEETIKLKMCPVNGYQKYYTVCVTCLHKSSYSYGFEKACSFITKTNIGRKQ